MLKDRSKTQTAQTVKEFVPCTIFSSRHLPQLLTTLYQTTLGAFNLNLYISLWTEKKSPSVSEEPLHTGLLDE